MAFFRCVKCGCEEDTALCNYWSAQLQEISPLCSACDPKIRKWHGEFPRKREGSLPEAGADAIKMRTKVLDAAVELADARKTISAALGSS
jgi:hypothetical protein